jgi:hypothetical protein
MCIALGLRIRFTEFCSLKAFGVVLCLSVFLAVYIAGLYPGLFSYKEAIWEIRAYTNDNIKMNLTEIVCDDVEWIRLVQDTVYRQ